MPDEDVFDKPPGPVQLRKQNFTASRRLGDAEDDRGLFRRESSEQAIPDDQHAGEISVDVFGIHAVVHAVVLRRVENEPKGARQI